MEPPSSWCSTWRKGGKLSSPISTARLLYHSYVHERAPRPVKENLSVWLRDSIRGRGAFGTLRFYAAGLLELLRDLTPERRRSRYGDIDFDFEHGVDTTWATVSLRTRVREWLRGVQYQASEPQLFREILESVPADLSGLTFIDLGCGKGRTLLMASEYPFRRVIGVEFLPELNDVALRNIERYESARQKCFAIESHAGDARRFEFPVEPIVLYLFNPFPEHVLREVLNNLERSLRATPRPAFLIYHNLVHEAVFDEQRWLRRVHRTHQFAIYAAEFSGSGTATNKKVD